MDNTIEIENLLFSSSLGQLNLNFFLGFRVDNHDQKDLFALEVDWIKTGGAT